MQEEEEELNDGEVDDEDDEEGKWHDDIWMVTNTWISSLYSFS